MGAWSVSINGNDFAQDMKLEYMAVFSTFSLEQGIALLDRYVQDKLDGQRDIGTWTDYTYSLADFLWKHGLLTPPMRDRALTLIDEKAALDLYSDVRARERTLDLFREKLTSPQPPPKKGRVRLNTKPVFQPGDVIALRLCTRARPYYPSHYLTSEELYDYDGQWFLLHKLCDQVSWQSRLVPRILDLWPVFELGRRCYTHIPQPGSWLSDGVATRFFCDGTMAPYRRREARVIENCQTNLSDGSGVSHGEFLSYFCDESLLIAQREAD